MGLNLLGELGVDVTEGEELFHLLDTDRSGGVDSRELINGLLRLRGNSKSLDVALILREVNHISDQVDRLEDTLLYNF